MIIIDNNRCTQCNTCLSIRGGYCLNSENGGISIDYSLCNECAQCIAVCPSQAFSVDGAAPAKIDRAKLPSPENIEEALRSRRSVRHFKKDPISRKILNKIISIGRYVPTMNGGIEALIIDDPQLYEELNARAFKYYKGIYNAVFNNFFFYNFAKLFAPDLHIPKKKLEHSMESGRILYPAPALILLIGDPRVILTEISAQYHAYNMMLYAESLGLGTCLMDSAKIAANAVPKIKKLLGIPKKYKVLCALILGYPDIRICYKPEGLIMRGSYNSYSPQG